MKTPLLVFALAATAGYSSTRADLIAFYSFDNSADPFEDTSGMANHISGVAGPGGPNWSATSGFNSTGAYVFSGDGDRLIAPIDVQVAVMPKMTWGAWVRTNDLTPGLRKVMGHDNGAWDRTLGLDTRDNGIFRYTSFTGIGRPVAGFPILPGPANTTDWTFLAAAYDEVLGGVTVYVDLDASTTGDPLVSASEAARWTGNPAFNTFAIGNIRPDNDNEGWNGAIDQVFVYNEYLDAAKMTAIRNRGRKEILGIADSDPDIAVSPPSLFGDLTGFGAGPGSMAQTAMITNTGATQDLSLSGLAITGPDRARYALTPPLPTTVAPGSNAVVEVVFTPAPEGGSYAAALEIASDDFDSPLVTVILNATVTSDPQIEVAAPPQLFGSIAFNEIPATITRSITVRNAGVVNTLTLDPPTLSGFDQASYSIQAPATIAPGEEARIDVTLTTGGTEGIFTAELQLTSNDPDSLGFTIGLDAELVLVTPASLLAFFCFDKEANPFEDLSGNGNHITGVAGPGGPTWGAASGFESSGAYEFSGDGDRLIVPVDINTTPLPQMSWGAWVRTNDLSSGLRKVMGHDNGAWDRTLGLDNRDNGVFRYTSFTGIGRPVLGTPAPVNTTDWTFLAASYDQDRGSVTVYLDLNASTFDDPLEAVSEPATFNAGWPEFAIGAIRPDIDSEGWNGAIDNVFVYKGNLTNAQLEAIRRGGKSAIVGSQAGPRLAVTGSGDNLIFTWPSLGGKLYTLRSEVDPGVALDLPIDWPRYGGHENMAADPSGTNTLVVPRPADPFRLFVIEEFNAPPVAVFTDDFEGGAPGWTHGSDGAPGTLWELGPPSNVGPAAANSPANCFGTNLASDYDVNAEVWLQSPVIDLTTAGGATLRYFQFYDIEGLQPGGRVAILDADNGDAEVAILVANLSSFTTTWEEAVHVLPAAALGKRIKIEFRFTSDSFITVYPGWYIDDLQVTIP